MGLAHLIRNMTDIEDVEKVPFSERISFRSTYEMLRAGAAIDPQKTAIYFLQSGDDYEHPLEITYEQLVARVHQTANMLHDAGIGKDDVIGVILPNLPQSHSVIWGSEAAGIPCLINPFLGTDHMKDILQATKAKALITLGPTPGMDTWQKVASIRAELPDLKVIFQVMGEGSDKDNDGVYSFDESLGKHSAAAFDFDRVVEPGDIAAMFHTGGTTGSPKLALHTHLNEVHDSWCLSLFTGLTAKDVLLCGLPLFHVNGVMVTGLAPLSEGASIVLLSPAGYRDPGVIRNFYKIVDRYRATTFSGVPTIYNSLLQVPVGDADVSSLRFGICGAAPMPVDILRDFERHTGIKILEGYGLTEGTCASAVNPRDGERRVGSIGLRFPYEEMKTVVIDSEGKYVRDCPVGEIGVVAVKGINVFAGYLRPEHNEKAWLGDGWLNTGDLGRMDPEGYFWLTGRAKELIIRGGHNIDPAVIEDALYKHPAVQLAAAVGRPDSYAGEVPMAFVTLKAGNVASEEALISHCKAFIGEPAAVPKEICVVDSIPLTTVGKIFKPQLRWDAIVKVFSRELTAMSELAGAIEVTCGEDKVHGTLARIAIRPKAAVSAEEVDQKLHQLLGRYHVKYAVVLMEP